MGGERDKRPNGASCGRMGLVGIGLVGTAMAGNLLAGGYDLVGYDIVEDKCRRLESMGGTAARSPAAAASGRRCVLLSLMSSDIVREALAGAGGVLSADPLPEAIIDTTTGDPDRTVEIAAACAARGVAYLDATISGSSDAIARREGVFMVGGDRGVFDACRDVFDCLAERSIHVGPSGSGARAKLAVNLVMGLNRLALAEGLVFAERIGLDPAAFFEVARQTFAYSRIMDVKGPKMLAGDFTAAGRLAQHRKDVDLICRLAAEAGQELPLSAVHRAVLDAAIAAGDGDLDNAAVIREIRRRGPGG
ncbi:MAG TPA: NAD(P)-dependent oxidoreductase [Phycisphaerae bacterium]|nr:NAD(P)-dependent oxidoreductase [Phycisphaerae bacterium]